MALPQLVKDRLFNRERLDVAAKKANEYRVREYVKNYLKDLKEVLWILGVLPEKQVKKLFQDEDAFNFLDMAERALVYQDFMPLRLDDDGKLLAEKSLEAAPESGTMRYFSISRDATDQDKQRFGKLKRYLSRFAKFERSRPWAMYYAHDRRPYYPDRIYYKNLIKMAERDGYEPIELEEVCNDAYWLPRLTVGQKWFREVQQVLGGCGIRIDSSEDLEELAKIWRDHDIKKQQELESLGVPSDEELAKAIRPDPSKNLCRKPK